MHLSRRDLLRAGLLGGAAAVAGPVIFPSRHAYGAGRPIDPRGTTLAGTVAKGAEQAGGYRLLVPGRGEPHVLRTDLGVDALPGRERRRRPVVAFSHLTDVHIVDAQSPARVEFLDRYDDAFGPGLFDSAYRPQEMLTTQIADAMCRTVSQLRRGPVTGLDLAFAVSTGDNVDNAQLNEVRWFIDVMDGEMVTPDSGSPIAWEGVHDLNPLTYDVHYWHPDGTSDRPSAVADNPRAVYGFPTIPGLLDAARRPFKAHGIGMPWYSVFGNHDPLLQGNAPVNPVFQAILTGSLKVVGLAPGASPADVHRGLVEQDPNVLHAFVAGPARTVTADARRRALSRAEIMAEHLTTTGTPVGHGFTQANVDADVGYYAFDHGPHLRCVVLDTVNPGGYADGSIDRPQLAWLQQQLVANSTKAYAADGTLAPTGSSLDRLLVVFSHHTVGTMVNPFLAPGETQQRVRGPEVAALLGRFPNVILWVNGHTHINTVTHHEGPSAGTGFWEVNTAAHIDFPSQSRTIEIVDNRDGTLSVFATVIDLDVPLAYGGRLGDSLSLASLARELGANDWQQRTKQREGTVESRNVELLVRAPFELRFAPGPPANVPVDRPLPATGPSSDAALSGAALALAAAGVAAAARWSGPRPHADAGG